MVFHLMISSRVRQDQAGKVVVIGRAEGSGFWSFFPGKRVEVYGGGRSWSHDQKCGHVEINACT